MRKVIPPNRNSEPKVKRKAEPKLSIQLVPATQQLKEQLNPIRNTRREITIKPRKDITYLKDYLFKTYGVSKGAFLKLIANSIDINREWSSLETPNITLGDIYVALGKPQYFRLSYSFLFKIEMVGEYNERFEISIEQEKTLGDLTRTVEGRLDPFLPYIVLLKTENGWYDFSYSTMTIAELAESLGGNLVLSFKTELIKPMDSGEFSFDLDDFSKKKCRSEGCDSIGLFLCGNCKNTLYCSESCQKSHWEKEHKTKCIQSSISNSSSASFSFSSSSSGMGTQGILRDIKTKGF